MILTDTPAATMHLSMAEMHLQHARANAIDSAAQVFRLHLTPFDHRSEAHGVLLRFWQSMNKNDRNMIGVWQQIIETDQADIARYL